MENKTLIYIVGGVAVIGIGYYLYKKRQAIPKAQESATPVAETKSEDETMNVVAQPKMTEPKNPNPSIVAENMPTLTPITTSQTPSRQTPKVKLSKFEVELLLLKKCGRKPLFNRQGRIQKYEQCKNSFKTDLRGQGLISFDGMNTYSNMNSNFDINF